MFTSPTYTRVILSQGKNKLPVRFAKHMQQGLWPFWMLNTWHFTWEKTLHFPVLRAW